MKQSIFLEGVVNARELGGYTMQDGRRIKRGLLLRGGHLANATDKDIERLKSVFKVTQIFDFRTQSELEHSPDREIDGVANLWLPTIDMATDKPGVNSLPLDAYLDLENYLVDNSFNPIVQKVAKRMYMDMVANEYTQLQYAAFLQLLRQVEGAAFWHCSQGKDRTGLGAAFILAALGASRDTIMEDYALSNECYRDIIDNLSAKVIAKGGGKPEIEVIRTFIGANTDLFSEALDYMESECGTVLGYVRSTLLLSDADIEALRSRYLE